MKPAQDLKSGADLRKMDLGKLHTELKDIEQKFFKARFEANSGQSKRSDLKTKYQRQVARIKTVIAEKEVEAVKTAVAKEAEAK